MGEKVGMTGKELMGFKIVSIRQEILVFLCRRYLPRGRDDDTDEDNEEKEELNNNDDQEEQAIVVCQLCAVCCGKR